jgi:hypothetical protein
MKEFFQDEFIMDGKLCNLFHYIGVVKACRVYYRSSWPIKL